MILRTPISTRTDPLCPYATLVRSLFAGAEALRVARDEVVQQHQPGAGAEGRSDLAEPGIEAERQGGEDAVVRPVLEVLAHADPKSTRLNSSHSCASRMPSSA